MSLYAVSLSLLSVAAVAPEITIYGVSDILSTTPTETVLGTDSRTFSLVGVGSDGATTFIEEIAGGNRTLVDLTTTAPISAMVTQTFQFVESSAGFVLSPVSASGLAFPTETCVFGTHDEATCYSAHFYTDAGNRDSSFQPEPEFTVGWFSV
ncbi:hypothetical protein C8F01DRAFT_1260001 [Mycena amicta]|nr:hypothetical protein C8F01DRAFT_1260001 [Mycena amicta]